MTLMSKFLFINKDPWLIHVIWSNMIRYCVITMVCGDHSKHKPICHTRLDRKIKLYPGCSLAKYTWTFM